MPKTCLLAAASAAISLASATITCAQPLAVPKNGMPSPASPHRPGLPVHPGWPHTPVHNPGAPAHAAPDIPRLKPTWMLEFIADRLPQPSAPNSRHLCRVDAVRQVLEHSSPLQVALVPAPPSLSDLDAARAWLSQQTASLVQAGEQAGTLRLQHLQLHQMECAAPSVSHRLQALGDYIQAGKPTFRTHGLLPGVSSADKAQGAYSYGWFQPFTMLTDGVSIQEKRVKRATENACDASDEMLRVIEEKRQEQKTCIDTHVAAAMDSPDGFPAYAGCYAILAPGFDGCIGKDGAGSGCTGDPERIHMPYLMSAQASSAGSTGLIQRMLQSVSSLLPAISAARIRFATADQNAQQAWLNSVLHLQTASDQEQILQDAQAARLELERTALASLAATMTRQQQEIAQQTREQARTQQALDTAQIALQTAQSRLTLAQRQADMTLKEAELAFVEDSGVKPKCTGSQEECDLVMETGFARSTASVDSFRAAHVAVQEATAARTQTLKQGQTVMQERLNLMRISMLLAQTQTLLDANTDQHTKRSQELNRNQAHLNALIGGRSRDRLAFDSARRTMSALASAPDPVCPPP